MVCGVGYQLFLLLSISIFILPNNVLCNGQKEPEVEEDRATKYDNYKILLAQKAHLKLGQSCNASDEARITENMDNAQELSKKTQSKEINPTKVDRELDLFFKSNRALCNQTQNLTCDNPRKSSSKFNGECRLAIEALCHTLDTNDSKDVPTNTPCVHNASCIFSINNVTFYECSKDKLKEHNGTSCYCTISKKTNTGNGVKPELFINSMFVIFVSMCNFVQYMKQ